MHFSGLVGSAVAMHGLIGSEKLYMKANPVICSYCIDKNFDGGEA